MQLTIDSLHKDLDTIECVGPSYRKNFTVYNANSTDRTIQICLETTNSNSFKLFPIEPGSSTPSVGQFGFDCWIITITILGKQYATFSVICEGANTGDEAWLYTNVVSGVTDTSEIYYTPASSLSKFISVLPQKVTFIANNNPSYVKREIGAVLATDKDGSQVISSIDRNFTKNSSFGLARTNPKITGNIKITVDSDNNIYLNSIDAVKELSDEKFKKYRITPKSSYAIDIKNFFGTTPSEQVFALYQADTQYTSSKRNLSEQYDRFYQYGAEALASKFYDEDFSFFAPIYLKNDIPDYFVIFRTTGPINSFSYDKPISEWPSEVVNSVLSTSTIIKTFSLKEDSSIGKYLRNIVNHPARKPSEMTVSFQQDGYTSFNGISYKEGSFAQKGELLYDYYQQENPIISSEEFLTLGFERNKIVSSNIINLEFLFDDPESDMYSINRYFGLYVNSVDLATIEMDENGFVQFSKQIGQTPIPRKGVDATKTSLAQFEQTNPDGIHLYANESSIVTGLKSNIFTSLASYVGITGTTLTLSLPGNVESKLMEGEYCTLISANGASGSCELLTKIYEDDNTKVTFLTTTFTGSFPFTSVAAIDFFSEEKFNNFKLNCFYNNYIENSGRLFYIKDRQDFLHSVKSTDIVRASVNAFDIEKMVEITLHETSQDITKFTGFLDIVTQTPAALLDKGKSSLYLKVNSFFEPNDYLEIKWENGPTSSGYPVRWRVIANETSLNPGESWPSYGLNSDAEGEYYFTYFHPGNSTITINDFVKSIESSFKRFPFKNFEILAKGDTLYFKSTESGLASEKMMLNFYMDFPVISVMGITAPAFGNAYFIGASDRNKTRAKIDKNVANGMFLDEYISTSGNFSLPKKYKIFEEMIVSSPYLDEPVYDETGENLLDFIDADLYHVIVLENETQPIQLTSDEKLTSYELFRPSFGILSILPFRDFDTDFHSSDYSKSYTPELIEYFGRTFQPLYASLTGSHYEFDKDVIFDVGLSGGAYIDPVYVPFIQLLDDGQAPPLYSEQNMFKFEVPGATALLVGPTMSSSPSNVLLMPGKKALYFNENEMSKFKGFLSLSPINTPENEAVFQTYENLWDPKRFEFQTIDSEYDRLAENYLKTLCLKSRVVPYSLKWVYDGKDIRENDYRLNWSRAFGVMNFSPSLQDVADPKYHTHEWPYLDCVPDSFPIADYPENSFSYMYEPLSEKYDFSSITTDWFKLYFSTGYPVEKYIEDSEVKNSPVDNAEKYSTFEYESFTGRTFTMFRGQKIEISDTKNPQKYHGYKFSAIIKTKHSDFLVNEDPIYFNTIVNEKWKFIVLVITVRVSSYRYPQGRISYTDLYTLENCNYIATIIGSMGLPSYDIALPCDYKLSEPLNLGGFSTDGMYHFDTYLTSDTFLENLQEEILEVNNSIMNRLCCFANYFGFDISVSLPVPISDGIKKTTVKLTDTNGFVEGNIKYGTTLPYNASSIVFPNSSIDWGNFTFFHESGGNRGYLGLRERLTFFEISSVMMGKSEKSLMTYDIYGATGTHTKTTSPDFSFSTILPETLIRKTDYVPVSDQDKPSQLLTHADIGAVLETSKDLQTLYRYQGNFYPKFKDVLKFWLRESEDFEIATSRDYVFCNTHFATEINNFSILKNQYYNKVSSSEILSISANSGYLPVYPLVKEISIDKKNEFAWSSNWDDNYYRMYSDVDTYDEVRGTENMKEVKSMFGSKCMRVPKFFDLYQFTSDKMTTNDNLSQSSKEFSYIDYGTHCVSRINVYDRLLREMLGTSVDLRAKTEFLKTVSIIPDSFTESEIDEKVRDYLIKNIMPLYEIQTVKLYVLQTGNSDTDQIATTANVVTRPVVEIIVDPINGEITLDENSLFLKNYVSKKDLKITNVGNMIFEIDYPFDSRYYTSISFGVSVKRI